MKRQVQEKIVNDMYDKINESMQDPPHWGNRTLGIKAAVINQVTTAVEDLVYLPAIFLYQHTLSSPAWVKGLSV